MIPTLTHYSYIVSDIPPGRREWRSGRAKEGRRKEGRKEFHLLLESRDPHLKTQEQHYSIPKMFVFFSYNYSNLSPSLTVNSHYTLVIKHGNRTAMFESHKKSQCCGFTPWVTPNLSPYLWWHQRRLPAGSKTFTNALHDAFFWSDELPHEERHRGAPKRHGHFHWLTEIGVMFFKIQLYNSTGRGFHQTSSDIRRLHFLGFLAHVPIQVSEDNSCDSKNDPTSTATIN